MWNATKYHKLYTKWRRFQISLHLSCEDVWNYSICGQILAFSTCFMYRNLKFLHMTAFFSTDTVLVSVTNMRYGLLRPQSILEFWLAVGSGFPMQQLCLTFSFKPPLANSFKTLASNKVFFFFISDVIYDNYVHLMV